VIIQTLLWGAIVDVMENAPDITMEAKHSVATTSACEALGIAILAADRTVNVSVDNAMAEYVPGRLAALVAEVAAKLVRREPYALLDLVWPLHHHRLLQRHQDLQAIRP